MPIDAGIYGQFAQAPEPINTPFENLKVIMEIRNRQAAQAALEEERRSAADLSRQKAEELRQKQAAQAAFDNAIQQGKGVRDASLAYATIHDPGAVPDLTAFFDKSAKSKAEIDKLNNELNDKRLDHAGHSAAYILDTVKNDADIIPAAQAAAVFHADQFPEEAQSAQQIADRLKSMSPQEARSALEQIRNAAPYYQAIQTKQAERGPTIVPHGSSVLAPDNKTALFTSPDKPNFESKPVMLDGKEALVNFNSDTGKSTLPSTGEDVSSRVKPMPPAAMRVQVNTGAPAATQYDASRPDPATANKVDPSTGFTPNALFQNALVYGLEGKLPAMGMGSNPLVRNARSAIQNKASAIAAAAGTDLPTVQAEYRANSTTLNKLLPQAQATANFANTAKDNIQLALGQSPKVSRTDSAWINQMTNSFTRGATPAAALTKFEIYIYTAAREYAKVTTGGALSAQALSDTAAKEATKLLNAAQSPEAFQAAVGAMQDDMDNTIRQQSAGIKKVSGNIANFFAAANGTPLANDSDTNKGTESPDHIVWRLNGMKGKEPK